VEIGEELEKTPVEVFKEILQKDIEAKAVFKNQSEDILIKILAQDYVMVGSDGYALDDHSILSRGHGHPRDFGTFPRVLAKYVRDMNVLKLEDAIFKMSGLPAKKLGLRDRGVLKAGNCADIVLFNLAKLKDRADFSNPRSYPEGIEHVFVNGALTLADGAHTGKRHGEVLSR